MVIFPNKSGTNIIAICVVFKFSSYDDFVSLAEAFNTYKTQHPNAGLISCLATHGGDDWVWGSCVLSALIPRTTGDPKWIEKAALGDRRFNSNEFTAALQVIADWVNDGIIDASSASTDDGTGKANFAAGKYLMYIDGQWGFGEANYADLADDIKLFAIPAITNGVASMSNCMAAAWQVGYGITKKGTTNAAVLDAAKRWMAYFNSEEETILRLRDGGISSPIIRNFIWIRSLQKKRNSLHTRIATSSMLTCQELQMMRLMRV